MDVAWRAAAGTARADHRDDGSVGGDRSLGTQGAPRERTDLVQPHGGDLRADQAAALAFSPKNSVARILPLLVQGDGLGEVSCSAPDPLEVSAPLRKSEQPLPPLAMLAATSPGTRRGQKIARLRAIPGTDRSRRERRESSPA